MLHDGSDEDRQALPMGAGTVSGWGREAPPMPVIGRARELNAVQQRELRDETARVVHGMHPDAMPMEQEQTTDTDYDLPDSTLPPRRTGARTVPGDEFVLHTPDIPEAVWGEGSDVLWPEGEALGILASTGLGKTTLAGLLVRALIGLDTHVLDLPVQPAKGRVLYLAMDRPRQAARSLRRQFRAEEAAVLRKRLVVMQGPPPMDMAVDTSLLLRMAREQNASHVIVDSLKDAAVGLTDDAVAAGYNRARQLACSNDVQVLELHHPRKPAGGTTRTALSIDDFYGSTWLASGMGSVVALNGEVGGDVLELRHLKQPAADVGPLQITVDRAAGTMTTNVAADVAGCLSNAWLTVREITILFTRKAAPTRAATEKVRRQLLELVKSGAAEAGSAVQASNGRTADRFRRSRSCTVPARDGCEDLS